MHHKLGVRAAHMPIMKGLLLSTLRAAAADLFSASVEAAWGFVWYSHAHTHKHAHTRTQAHTHTHTHTQTHTCTCTNAHTFPCTHTSVRAHTTQARTQTPHTHVQGLHDDRDESDSEGG